MPTNSLLTRDESGAIKGLLIILIMLGHNITFTTVLVEYQMMGYLYTFHIHSFFLIPFLYGHKNMTMNRLVDMTVKLYIPLCLVYLVTSFFYFELYTHGDVIWGEYLLSYLNGNANIINKYGGVQFLWFLPALYALMLIKNWYYTSSTTIKLFMIAVSIYVTFYYDPTSFLRLTGETSSIAYYLPNFIAACKYLWMGVLLREVLTSDKLMDRRWLWLVIFLVGSIAYFLTYWTESPYYVYLHSRYSVVLLALYAAMPVVFMVILFGFRTVLSESKLLKAYGDLSMQVYLISAFTGYVVWFVIESNQWINLSAAMLSQVFIMTVSYYIAKFIHSKDKLRQLCFPQSYADLKQLIMSRQSIPEK